MPKVCVCISIYDINTKIHPFPFPSLSLTKHSRILLTSDSSLSLLWPTYIWNLFWGTSGPSAKFLKSLIRKKNRISWNSVDTRAMLYFFFFFLLYIIGRYRHKDCLKSTYSVTEVKGGLWQCFIGLQSCTMGGSVLCSWWQLNTRTIQSFKWDPHVQIKPVLGEGRLHLQIGSALLEQIL